MLTSDEGSPLLAQWHYGLGRVVTWTSDLGTRWTNAWLSWDQNTRFWEQMLRWAMGPPINRDFRVDISRTGNVAVVRVEDIKDGRFSDLQPLKAMVISPGGGSASEMDLRQVAPGQYEARIIADTPGVYEVRVSEPNLPRNPGRTELNGFVVPPASEFTSFVPDEQALRRIASETGGTVRSPRPGELYHGPRTALSTRWDPVWPVFVVLALIAFLLDVAVRRLRPSTLRALFGLTRART